jgi:hypothetical protein
MWNYNRIRLHTSKGDTFLFFLRDRHLRRSLANLYIYILSFFLYKINLGSSSWKNVCNLKVSKNFHLCPPPPLRTLHIIVFSRQLYDVILRAIASTIIGRSIYNIVTCILFQRVDHAF